jgi:iron complex outermembrane receptor protein
MLNLSNFESDGYRQNSASTKEQATAKFKFSLSEATRISVLANWFDQEAQDPSGLTKSYVYTARKSAPSIALTDKYRVSRSNKQIGINIEQYLNENNTLNIIGYIGHRDNLQFLASKASQISRDFGGSEVRWTNKGDLLNRPYSLTAGLSYGSMNDDRFDMVAVSGTISTPTNFNRNEVNIATNFDQFIQGQWSALESVDIHAGIRRTKVNLKVKDNLVDLTSSVAKWKDGSGSITHEKTTPVIGAIWKVTPALNLYTNFGKGFETPTFIEVAYNDTSGAGPNLALKPSTSDNYEVGLKAFFQDNTRLNIALFRTNTENELVATQTGTYAVYANAGKTKREGIELSVDTQLEHNVGLYAAYTYLNARFDSPYHVTGTDPATTYNVISGNYIPGIYRNQLYGEVSWKAPNVGFTTAFEGRYNSKVYVDDRNSDIAPSYSVFNLRAGFKQNIKNWTITEYARIENLFDKNYIGSVRVNDSNSRFYEPAAGRNWLMGLNVSYRL